MTGLERYWLTTPTGRRPLNPSFMPTDTLSPVAVTHNLFRAFGYTEVFDLSDGLPDPVPITLRGVIRAGSEVELARRLAKLLAEDVKPATLIDRDTRNPTPLLSGWLVAAPYKSNSRIATVTISLIPARVPDPASPSPYFF